MKNLKKLALLVALTGITTGVTITPASAFTFGNIGAIKPNLMVERVINTSTEPEGVINGTTTMIKVGKYDIINLNKDSLDVRFTVKYRYDEVKNEMHFDIEKPSDVEVYSKEVTDIIQGKSINLTLKMNNLPSVVNLNFKKVK